MWEKINRQYKIEYHNRQAKNIKITESNKLWINDNAKVLLNTKKLTPTPTIRPARKPSTVLFGDILLANFLFPYLLPYSYAAMSDKDIEINKR